MEPDELGEQAERIAAAWHAASGVIEPAPTGVTLEHKPWEETSQEYRDHCYLVARTLLENGVISTGPEASEGAVGFSRDQLRGNPDRYRYVCEECGYEGDKPPTLDADGHTFEHEVYAVPIREAA